MKLLLLFLCIKCSNSSMLKDNLFVVREKQKMKFHVETAYDYNNFGTCVMAARSYGLKVIILRTSIQSLSNKLPIMIR